MRACQLLEQTSPSQEGQIGLNVDLSQRTSQDKTRLHCPLHPLPLCLEWLPCQAGPQAQQWGVSKTEETGNHFPHPTPNPQHCRDPERQSLVLSPVSRSQTSPGMQIPQARVIDSHLGVACRSQNRQTLRVPYHLLSTAHVLVTSRQGRPT